MRDGKHFVAANLTAELEAVAIPHHDV